MYSELTKMLNTGVSTPENIKIIFKHIAHLNCPARYNYQGFATKPACGECIVCLCKKVLQTEVECTTCKFCQTPTTNTGTKLCDNCWEMYTRMSRNVTTATSILVEICNTIQSPREIKRLAIY